MDSKNFLLEHTLDFVGFYLGSQPRKVAIVGKAVPGLEVSLRALGHSVTRCSAQHFPQGEEFDLIYFAHGLNDPAVTSLISQADSILRSGGQILAEDFVEQSGETVAHLVRHFPSAEVGYCALGYRKNWEQKDLAQIHREFEAEEKHQPQSGVRVAARFEK